MLTSLSNYDSLPAAGSPGMIDAFFIDTLHKKSMKTVRQSFGASVDRAVSAFAKRFAMVTLTGSGISAMGIGSLDEVIAQLRTCSQRGAPQGFTLSITIMTDSATRAEIDAALLGVQS